MRRFHSVLLATATLALPLSAAAPAWAQVTVDPNALNALGGPVLPAPPPAARTTPAHHPQPAHKRRHPHPGRKQPAAAPPATTAAPAPTPAPAAAPAAVKPPAAATGPTEQEKGLGPSFTTIPTLPGAAPPLPAKPAPLPAPKATPAPAAKPAAAPPGASLALPSGTPPAPPAIPTTAPAAQASPPAPAAPAAPAPKPTAAKPSGSALPAGADRMTLPYAGQDTALPEAESAMLRAFVQRYGPQAQYSVQAFASVPAGDDDPSTPRRIALDRARAVQSVLLGAGAAADHVRLIARGNAGGTPPDRVEVVAIPATPGHTAPSSAP